MLAARSGGSVAIAIRSPIAAIAISVKTPGREVGIWVEKVRVGVKEPSACCATATSPSAIHARHRLLHLRRRVHERPRAEVVHEDISAHAESEAGLAGLGAQDVRVEQAQIARLDMAMFFL